MFYDPGMDTTDAGMLEEEGRRWLGWSRVERRLLSLESSFAYISITDRTDRRREDLVAKVDLTPEALKDHLDRADLGWDIDPTTRKPIPTHRLLMGAAVRWAKDRTLAASEGEARTFRLIAYQPKGVDREVVGQWRMEPLEVLPDEEIPSPAKAEAAAAGRSFDMIGRVYDQLGQTVENHLRILNASSRNMVDNHNAMQKELREDVKQGREDLNTLLGLLGKEKIDRIEDAQAHLEEVKQQQLGSAAIQLGGNFLGQLSALAQLYLTHKLGLNPQSLKALEVVSQAPEILELLQDPAVTALLQNPEQRAQLLPLFGMFREQAHLLTAGQPHA